MIATIEPEKIDQPPLVRYPRSCNISCKENTSRGPNTSFLSAHLLPAGPALYKSLMVSNFNPQQQPHSMSSITIRADFNL